MFLITQRSRQSGSLVQFVNMNILYVTYISCVLNFIHISPVYHPITQPIAMGVGMTTYSHLLQLTNPVLCFLPARVSCTQPSWPKTWLHSKGSTMAGLIKPHTIRLLHKSQSPTHNTCFMTWTSIMASVAHTTHQCHQSSLTYSVTVYQQWQQRSQ